MNYIKILLNGIFKENPTFVSYIGHDNLGN